MLVDVMAMSCGDNSPLVHFLGSGFLAAGLLGHCGAHAGEGTSFVCPSTRAILRRKGMPPCAGGDIDHCRRANVLAFMDHWRLNSVQEYEDIGTRVAFFTVLRVAKQKSSSARRSRLRPPRALAAAAAEPLGRR